MWLNWPKPSWTGWGAFEVVVSGRCRCIKAGSGEFYLSCKCELAWNSPLAGLHSCPVAISYAYFSEQRVHGVWSSVYADGWQYWKCRSFGWISINTLNKLYFHEVEIICNEMVPYDLSFDHDNWQKSVFEQGRAKEVGMGRQWWKSTKSGTYPVLKTLVVWMDFDWFMK
jgi:hypothetical protein